MVTAKRLIAGSALTGALVTYYTVPAAITTIVKELILCNTDVIVNTVVLHIIPSAGSALVANQIFKNISLQAGETKIFGLSQVLSAGAFVQASASVAAVVSLTISGVEIT